MSSVAVVGGGVIGLCTAFALHQRGVPVTVFDAGPSERAASHVSAGWIVPTLAEPFGGQPGLGGQPRPGTPGPGSSPNPGASPGAGAMPASSPPGSPQPGVPMSRPSGPANGGVPGAVPAAAPATPASQAAKIQSLGASRQHADHWKRTPNATGTGAVHVKTFHCKLTEDALHFMDQAINEWLDAHPQYEVKFVTSSVGTFTGKLKEPALICQVWV